MYESDSIFNDGIRSVIEAQFIDGLQSVEIPPFVIHAIVVVNILSVPLFLVLLIALLCRPLSSVVDHHDDVQLVFCF